MPRVLADRADDTSRSLPHLIARPLIAAWLATSPHSWQRRVMADDTPHVHAPGTNPDRVLVAGDGAAAGRGVLTHDLGLPGFLARSLSRHTGRATDVHIVVSADMTVQRCHDAIRPVDLFRFDVILLSLGGTEALALTDVDEWQTAFGLLLDDLEEHVPVATQVFLLSVPFFSGNSHFPTRLADVVDRHVHLLNLVMRDLTRSHPRVKMIPLTPAGSFERVGSHHYQQWAKGISHQISAALDPARSRSDYSRAPDETARQHALDGMEIGAAEADPVLDSLLESVRRTFAAPIAAVELIDGDRLVTRAISGMDRVSLPRGGSFCDITIQHTSGLVVEDAAADPRFADYPTVTGEPHIRFYAGHPIESATGHRIGALCVVDTVPRTLTPLDLQLLQTLAHYVQERLWRKASS